MDVFKKSLKEYDKEVNKLSRYTKSFSKKASEYTKKAPIFKK
ncbi:MAG: hypothetical protein ACLFUH_09820 [Bacteroidales bacterium]